MEVLFLLFWTAVVGALNSIIQNLTSEFLRNSGIRFFEFLRPSCMVVIQSRAESSDRWSLHRENEAFKAITYELNRQKRLAQMTGTLYLENPKFASGHFKRCAREVAVFPQIRIQHDGCHLTLSCTKVPGSEKREESKDFYEYQVRADRPWYSFGSMEPRAMEACKSFVEACLIQYAKTGKRRRVVQFLNAQQAMTMKCPPCSKQSLSERLFLNPEVKVRLEAGIKRFLGSRKAFEEANASYHYTVMFTGIPGTGKTGAIKEICAYYDMNLDIVTASSGLSAAQIYKSCTSGRNRDKMKALVFEELDLFDLSESKHEPEPDPFESLKSRKRNRVGLSISDLLCFLDGTFKFEGLMIFVTTNYPEKLDPRIIREGRINLTAHLGPLTDPDEIERLARTRFLDSSASEEELAQTVPEMARANLTLAQISQIFETRASMEDSSLPGLLALKVKQRQDLLD